MDNGVSNTDLNQQSLPEIEPEKWKQSCSISALIHHSDHRSVARVLARNPGEIGDRAGGVADAAHQSQAVGADLGVLGIDHHVFKK